MKILITGAAGQLGQASQDPPIPLPPGIDGVVAFGRAIGAGR